MIREILCHLRIWGGILSKLVITQMPFGEKELQVSALIEENRLVDLSVHNLAKPAILGNIYVGKVDRVAVDLKAVFVRISVDQVCFLPWKDCEYAIYKTRGRLGIPKAGDELLVQVSRDALKEKLPSVTCNLSISGRYLVVTSGETKLGTSNKLSKEEQQRLKSILSEVCTDDRIGVIARTGARDISSEKLREEYCLLHEQIQRIITFGASRNCYSCLMQSKSEWQGMLEHIPVDKVEDIVLDHPAELELVKEYIRRVSPSLLPKVRLYEDMLLPLYKLYSFEKVIHDAMQKKVWLKSGGFLVIEQTEAFVVIDVNSGKSVTKKKAEEAYRKINLEAAAEIAYQLRIRQLSGTILIDFINMSNREHIDEVLHVLRNAVKKDFSKTVVIDVTALQITEMTRQKTRRSLLEELR